MAKLLVPGDLAPWFHAAALGGSPRYAFDTVAGRAIVLLFHGSAGWPASQAALQVVERHRHLFDDANACFFGVSIDPRDVTEQRIEPSLPGIRWFLDQDRAVSGRYGAVDNEREAQRYRPHWLLLDAMLRVVDRAEISDGETIMAGLEALIGHSRDHGQDVSAPVLIAPRILEPALCRQLIELYERQGGEESGFMREENGMTVLKVDHAHKRRSDCTIEDEQLIAALRVRLNRFLRPMISRAFQFDATRIERWIVACYDDDQGGGHFRAHRDNTTKGTAHRKFACTINLNAEDYEGAICVFPNSADAPIAHRLAAQSSFPARCCMKRRPSLAASATPFCHFCMMMPARRCGKRICASCRPSSATTRPGCRSDTVRQPMR